MEYFNKKKLEVNTQNIIEETSSNKKNLKSFENLSPVKSQTRSITCFKLDQKKDKLKSKMNFNKMQPSKDNFLEFNFTYDDITNWDLNIFDMTSNQMIALVYRIFETNDWISKFNITDDTFFNFMWTCNYYYSRKKNPFHNFKHGVTVCHAANWFVQKSSKLSNILTDEEKMGFVIAALGHDLDHGGRNNGFEINTHSRLAIRYNDQSPLENRHCAVLFKILNGSDKNLLSSQDNEVYNKVRKMMIKNILHTDMAVHFLNLSTFKKNMLENPNYGMDPQNTQEKLEVTGTFIHAADLSGSVKNISISTKWTNMINKEFSDQYAEEQALNIPQTPYFANLEKLEVFYKSEFSFQTFIISPLFSLVNVFENNNDVENVMATVNNNVKYYSDKHQEVTLSEVSQLENYKNANSGL